MKHLGVTILSLLCVVAGSIFAIAADSASFEDGALAAYTYTNTPNYVILTIGPRGNVTNYVTTSGLTSTRSVAIEYATSMDKTGWVTENTYVVTGNQTVKHSFTGVIANYIKMLFKSKSSNDGTPAVKFQAKAR